MQAARARAEGVIRETKCLNPAGHSEKKTSGQQRNQSFGETELSGAFGHPKEKAVEQKLRFRREIWGIGLEARV